VSTARGKLWNPAVFIAALLMMTATNIFASANIVAGRTNAVVSLTGIPGCCHDLLWTTNLQMTGDWPIGVSNVAFTAGTMRITNTVPAGDPQRVPSNQSGLLASAKRGS
jgi:hypothetical protein